MNLELFLTTINEYKRFAEQLPYDKDKSIVDSYDEATYIAIQTRLMLLRKYTSKNKNNHVYFENLIDEALERFPDKSTHLNNQKERFLQVEKQSFEQLLSDGTKLNLYKSIEDVMYGLYLHADQDKINRLSHTNELMRFACTKKYVEDIEFTILEFDAFLKEYNITIVNEVKREKAPMIYLGDSLVAQNVTQSPFWSNIHGKDATDEDVREVIKNYTKEECQIMLLALLFLEEIKKDTVSIELMKEFVYEPQIDLWGDFSVAASLYKKIPNVGINSGIKFNEQKNAAYIRLNPNVESVFIISEPHLVTDVYEITFIKNENDMWRIFAFGGHIDPYIREE